MWKKLVDTKRCLVPATGFYEWKKIGTDKQPFYIKLKDESVFAMAGLYEEWTEQESGEIVMSFSIVTTAPNKSMREIHDRMPVILDKTEEKEWLNEELSGSDVMPLLNSYPDKGMELYPVDKAVGKVANNTIELTYPLNEAT
jgi:putative SOS response-associated peptidase YedK